MCKAPETPVPCQRYAVSTKTCPSCGEVVPAAATRCKHCFYEFHAAPKKKGAGILLILGTIAAMVCVGAGVMYYVLNVQAVKQNVVVDQETTSIVWTRTYADKTETDRLPFADVREIELVIGGKKSTWEVNVITNEGKRIMLHQSSDTNLKGYADHLSNVMDKPLVEVRNLKNFDEQYTLDD